MSFLHKSRFIHVNFVIFMTILLLVGVNSAARSWGEVKEPAAPDLPFCADIQDISESECYTLEAIYNSTGGNAWTNKTGWMNDNYACTWYGVTCSSGHIYWLSLISNNLSGSLPSEISGLPYLEQFNVHDNDLTGPIPDFSTLVNMQRLTLSLNQLTGIAPPEIGNLTNLVSLRLQENSDLFGPIPSEWTALTSLNDFWYFGTDICIPRDGDVQVWLDGISSVSPEEGPICPFQLMLPVVVH